MASAKLDPIIGVGGGAPTAGPSGEASDETENIFCVSEVQMRLKFAHFSYHVNC